jgi:hypothetical protein
METRPLRQFKSHELRNLFDQEREVWQHQLYWDYSEPQRVISAMVDAGTLPGFVAMQDGDPVAYTFYVEVSGKGLLGGCFASRHDAGESAEERLLEESLAALKGIPRFAELNHSLSISETGRSCGSLRRRASASLIGVSW